MISQFSLTRIPDGSETRSWFSIPQPGTSTVAVYVANSGVDTPEATVLPSVSTILATMPSCSVNDTLTSVLPDAVPEASSAAVPSRTGVETATCDTAEDADSESQECETNPPDNRKSSWYSVIAPLSLLL